MKLITYITLFICLTCSTQAISSEISLIFPLVDGWAHKTDKSYAPEAIKRITKGKFGTELNLTFRPFKRALTDFGNKKYDCFVGGDEKTMMDFAAVKTVSSSMIRNTSLRAYTLKGEKKILTKKELLGKNIVYVRGLDLSSLKFKLDSSKTTSLNDVNQAVKIMKAKRSNVFLHWFPSTEEVMRDFHNDGAVILYTIKEKINCHNTKENREFISHLNDKIIKFQNNGGLKKLHNDFYGELPFAH